MKETVSLEILCSGLPLEFQAFFLSIKKIEFNEEPPYQGLLKIFNSLSVKLGIDGDIGLKERKIVALYLT